MNSRIKDIPLRFNEKAVLRLLGRRRPDHHADISPRLRRQLDKGWEDIQHTARPEALYAAYPAQGRERGVLVNGECPFHSRSLSRIFHNCEQAVVFVTTLGGDVDDLILNRLKSRPSYASILDAAASAAVESAADHVEKHIRERLGQGWDTTRRYSPGHCDWPVRDQKRLFSLLPHHHLRIRLTEGSHMSPRKSLSGIIGVFPEDHMPWNGNACLFCQNIDCPHRRN